MSRRRRFLFVLVPLTVGLLILVTTVVPFPQVYHEHDYSFGPGANFGCGVIDTTPGTPITFDWETESSTTFYAWHCVISYSGAGMTYSWTAVYEANGTRGSGEISSAGGWYFFGTFCSPGLRVCITSNATVGYFGPLLDLWTPSM